MTALTLCGYGYVGKAVYNAFKDVHNIKIIDPAYNDNNMSYTDMNVIICVGTPFDPLDGCDISAIIDVMTKLPPHSNVLIKSTVDMKGVKRLEEKFSEHKITFSPEFLRGDTANEDFLNAEYHIFGGGNVPFWKDVFLSRFPIIEIYECTSMEASVIKYAENAFLGMKVTFFNQLKDIADIYECDFDAVRELLTKDDRINDDHSYVTEERGYGGHCLPKDIDSLLINLEEKNYTDSIMKSVQSYNNKIRK